MKKFFRGIMLCMVFTLLAGAFPFYTSAQTLTTEVSREYLENGFYYETVLIIDDNVRSTLKGASKRTSMKDSNGNTLWYVQVTADFTFNGSSPATCVSAKASAQSYNSNWKIADTKASRSGNSGTATALARNYMGGVFVGSLQKSVTIYCDKNGHVS